MCEIAILVRKKNHSISLHFFFEGNICRMRRRLYISIINADCKKSFFDKIISLLEHVANMSGTEQPANFQIPKEIIKSCIEAIFC